MAEDDLSSPRAAVFTAFNFSVEVDVPGLGERIVAAAFQECDGLEITHEVKNIREGGNNARVIRLTGQLAFGQVTLKRGMTANFDLWKWVAKLAADDSMHLRPDCHVVILSADRSEERARFVLSRVVPVKIKAPALNAKDGTIAIEELQLAYEGLSLEAP